MNDINFKFQEAIKIGIFSKLKTNNFLIDTIVGTFLLSLTAYVFNNLEKWQNNLFTLLFSFSNNITLSGGLNFFKRKCEIVIEGEKSSTTSIYKATREVSSNYSTRFKAIWFYVIQNIDNLRNVHNAKEMYSRIGSGKKDYLNNVGKRDEDILMICQTTPVEIDKDIFIVCNIFKEPSDTQSNQISCETEKITIKIYSYVYNFSYLKKYIDDIKYEYLISIKTTRLNKNFIYFLENEVKKEDSEEKFGCWSEVEFYSCRTFSNMFFDGKSELIEKINFFVNNRHWFESKGIPWTCGIGLHGPPGTGKTSFIKSLANLTKRNLVFISLKLIKTKEQLNRVFFEDTYNVDNNKGSINFSNKIIVLEDIDCIGDIVLKRENKMANNDSAIVNEVLKNFVGDLTASTDHKTTTVHQCLEPITLDDILNLWDGIRETPGRILIITSNHYDKLDSALIRPGRIDISHEFKNASHQVITDMYRLLFSNEIKEECLLQINEFFYSPAEIINIYLTSRTEETFIKRITQNVKV